MIASDSATRRAPAPILAEGHRAEAHRADAQPGSSEGDVVIEWHEPSILPVAPLSPQCTVERCRSLRSIPSITPMATCRCSRTRRSRWSRASASRSSAATATGKSTLLQILSGELAPDRGTVWRQPGARAARLVQDVPLAATAPGVRRRRRGAGRFGGAGAGVSPRRRGGGARQHPRPRWSASGRCSMPWKNATAGASSNGSRWCCRGSDLPPTCPWTRSRAAGSAGCCWRGRWSRSPTCLCSTSRPTTSTSRRSSGSRPSCSSTAGAIVFVTHDRAFLERLATRIVELDRGRLTSWPGDYATFLRKKDEWLANEAVQREKFDKRLAQEEAWLRQGIKARRTRDEGRVKALMAMRAERAARRQQLGRVRLTCPRPRPRARWCSRPSTCARPMATSSSSRIARREFCAATASASSGRTAPARRPCSAAAGRARARRGRGAARAPTCRSRITTSSASSSIPNGRWWTRSPTATTRSR